MKDTNELLFTDELRGRKGGGRGGGGERRGMRGMAGDVAGTWLRDQVDDAGAGGVAGAEEPLRLLQQLLIYIYIYVCAGVCALVCACGCVREL